jgi:hypothetical protein
MHKIRHLAHPNRLTTEGGFRLIRHFTPAHNRRRLAAYVARVWCTPDMQKWKQRHRLWKRTRAASAAQGGGHV